MKLILDGWNTRCPGSKCATMAKKESRNRYAVYEGFGVYGLKFAVWCLRFDVYGFLLLTPYSPTLFLSFYFSFCFSF